MLYMILRIATFISHSNYHIFQTVRHTCYKINQNFSSQIVGKHILFTSETPIHTYLLSIIRQYSMNFLLVSESPKTFTTTTLIIILLTIWTLAFFRQYNIFSTVEGITNLISSKSSQLSYVSYTPMYSSPIHKLGMWLITSFHFVSF
jgi:hypothetical protein